MLTDWRQEVDQNLLLFGRFYGNQLHLPAATVTK